MDILKQLLGRLHPLIVHLPIGFIILGLLLQVYDRKKQQHKTPIAIIYLWAGISALLACVTGYLQYLGEGFSFDSVALHLWSGVATTLFSFLMWMRLTRLSLMSFTNKIPLFALSIIFFFLISFTGHQGGNITHGEDYLIEPLPNSWKSALGFEVFEKKEIVLIDENWEDAILYTDVVEPILNNNCVSCHNPKKSKGELLLNTKEGILTSGENGPVLLANHPEKSDLLTRMELPKDDDEHMPPDGKAQPSKEEIKLIAVWIEKGLSFDKSIGELGLDKSLLQSFFPENVQLDYPNIEITAAPIDSINLVKSIGLHVDLISERTHFLKISALNKPSFIDTDFQVINALAPQISILDLGGTQVTDAIFEAIAGLPNLTILKLDNTVISGEDIELLVPLIYLKTINLSNTNFNEEHLGNLKEFEKLEKVYLFNLDKEKKGSKQLDQSTIILEYGNYDLPKVATDSISY